MYQSLLKRKSLIVSHGVLVATLLFIASGCGGGGGSVSPSSSNTGSSAGVAGASGRLTVFATDAFSDTYEQVWVKIRRVELLDAAGIAETVFDDPTGVSLNLQTLHDAAGQRFALLTSAPSVRSRTHTQVRVTLGDDAVLFAKGTSAGQTVPVTDTVARDGSGHPVLVFPLAGGGRNLGSGKNELTIDFDLTQFTVTGGKLTPTLREGQRGSLTTAERHEAGKITGTVSGLAGSAPDLSFTLSGAGGESLVVQTNSTTRIDDSVFNLVNGNRVEVRGIYDVSTDRFVATEIKIKEGSEGDGQGEAEVEGATSTGDATGGTFLLAASEVKGFLPTQNTVKVITKSDTVFRSAKALITGQAFYAALTGTAGAEAEGVYDAATNTLTARKVRLKAGDDGSGAENHGGNGNSGNSGGDDHNGGGHGSDD